MSNVFFGPYCVSIEKGFNLLYHVEKVVGGGDIFEPFLKSYVEKFAGQSISTDQWKDYLYEYFEKTHGQPLVDKLNTVDWDTWINGRGMPPVDPEFDTTLAKQCYDLADRWDKARNSSDLSGFSPSDVKSFTPGQKSKFEKNEVQ